MSNSKETFVTVKGTFATYESRTRYFVSQINAHHSCDVRFENKNHKTNNTRVVLKAHPGKPGS